jgi:hypothetical protein
VDDVDAGCSNPGGPASLLVTCTRQDVPQAAVLRLG